MKRTYTIKCEVEIPTDKTSCNSAIINFAFRDAYCLIAEEIKGCECVLSCNCVDEEEITFNQNKEG